MALLTNVFSSSDLCGLLIAVVEYGSTQGRALCASILESLVFSRQLIFLRADSTGWRFVADRHTRYIY